MANERETLQNVMQRLGRALERGTGTGLDTEEVRVVGSLLHAVGSAALGGGIREACAVCGRPEHREEAVGNYARHPYMRGVLVPVPGQTST